jgi:uncharacterized RDD family membrane protein YckC
MTAEVLTVRGLTGIDMAVRIAGPGTRSYAFLTDWMIRLLLALGWVLLALLLRLLPAVANDAPMARKLMIACGVLALATYFLYHPVLEVAMKGSTPGLRKAGARIVTMEGATPGSGALLIRNVFRLIDCLPAFYMLGLVCCVLTEKRVRFGDRVAGTVLVVDAAGSARSLARLGEQAQRSTLSLEALQLVHDLLERWPSLEDARRASLARGLLARLDPEFGSRAGAPPDSGALRAKLEALLAGGPGS